MRTFIFAASVVAGVEQVHLSLGDLPSEMIVSWATPLRGQDDNVTVAYRRRNDEDWSFASSMSEKNYTLKKGGWITKDYESPKLHSTLLTDLEPETEYNYKIGAFEGTFRTVKQTYPFTVAVVGDQGQTEFAAATTDNLVAAAKDVEFAFFVGDLSYADGNGERWDSWSRLTEPAYSRIPLMPLPGNHEIEYEANGRTFTSYKARFSRDVLGGSRDIEQQRKILDDDGKGHWYDTFSYEFGASYYGFTVGPVRFLAVNTYADAGPLSLQRAWLDREFACMDKDKTPWVIVGMHAPWYSTSKKHLPSSEYATKESRKNLESVVNRHKVPLVLSGHVHAYERSYPVCFDTVGEGPTYVIVGDGGNHEKLYDNWREEPWSAYRDGTRYGYATLTLLNDTHARWQWLTNKNDGPSDDDVILRNENFCATEEEEEEDDDDGFLFDCSSTDVIADVERRVAFLTTSTSGPTPGSTTKKSTRLGDAAIVVIATVAAITIGLGVATVHSLLRRDLRTPSGDKGRGWVEVDTKVDDEEDDFDVEMV